MQDSSIDMLMYYDGRPTSSYCGLWSLDLGILKGYYAFLYFNGVYRLKKQAACECSDSAIKAVASTEYEGSALVLANMSDEEKTLEIVAPKWTEKCLRVRSTTAEKDDETTSVAGAEKTVLKLPARAIMLVETDK